MEVKQGCLYVVGTPIGNLSDISERAVETLKNVDFIAAEDTRVSGILLSRLGLKKKFTSCHAHNIVSKSGEIIKRLKSGDSCAVVTDAGMPCISDPGEFLVRLCGENDIPVYVVPGACALTAALAVSGLDTRRFSFEGFLSVVKKQRTTHLESLKNSPYTLIFYEAPHKLRNTLADLRTFLGDRRIAVCRELTKLYEEVLRGRISDMIALYEEKSPKGEYVLVVASEETDFAESATDLKQASKSALELHHSGMGLSEAAKTVSAQTGLKKSDIYRETAKIIK
ncbi:MAG: 16S rRNA (cytidine(1402)-2'-O)-methyltransferase [Oscillospiraceae bacterium]|nr:16S rRNA (cytidine(1402)-2'-O)-methyltransferase [Oscillospiraceae bacterium]